MLVNIARNADAVLVLLDATDPEGLEHAESIPRFLERSRIVPRGRPVPEEMAISARVLPVHLRAQQVRPRVGRRGRRAGPRGRPARTFRCTGSRSRDGTGLEELRLTLYEVLEVLRVYSKEPGKKPDMNRPFVLKRGSTVVDLAGIIHKDIATTFRFARIWGSARFDGQPVEREHLLEDRDVVEIHAS